MTRRDLLTGALSLLSLPLFKGEGKRKGGVIVDHPHTPARMGIAKFGAPPNDDCSTIPHIQDKGGFGTCYPCNEGEMWWDRLQLRYDLSRLKPYEGQRLPNDKIIEILAASK